MTEDEIDRVNIALTVDGGAAIRRTMARSGLKKTEIVNRALQLHDYVDDKVRDGYEVVLRKDGEEDRIVKFI